jgi:ankyrin repeat protein/ketosteroid isomerase-like protein
MSRFFFLTALLPLLLCGAAPENPATVFAAIRADHLDTLRDLRAKGANINAPGDRSTPPLAYAAAAGSIEAMRMLLAAGADVNARTAFGATALHWATHDTAKMQLLVSHGADVNAVTRNKRTPLILAAFNNPSPEAVALLLEKGADLNAKDALGVTALLAATSGDRSNVAKLLVAKGMDPNANDLPGFTPLMNAASYGDVDLMRLLIAHGAKVNAVSAPPAFKVKNGPIQLGSFTPLLLSCTYGPFEAVQLLLDSGADVKAREGRGMTALHLAVSSEHRDPRIVKLLLDRGADPAAKTITGETAAEWAVKMGLDDAARVLGRNVPAASAVSDRFTPASGPAVRSAATRALALLQTTSGSFFVQGGCASCHSHDLTAFAAGIAREHGIAVNEKLLTEQTLQVRSQWKPLADALLERMDTPGGSEMNNFALLGLAAVGEKPDRYTDAMARNTANVQLQNGSWFAGAFSRTPVSDSVIGDTAISIRALRLFGPEGCRPEFEARIRKAREWLLQARAVYADDRAWRLLGLKWSGAQEPALREAARAILEQQRPDGGWSQNGALESDAYATGQALYALAAGGGLEASQPAYAKGVAWLVRTQAADGSWRVKRRAAPFQPYFESGFPYGHDQWISAFGTAWATAALSLAADGAPAVLALRR